MFCQLFYNYFLLSLIVNDLQMHFPPFFWLDPKETKTSLAICSTPSPLGRSFLSSISLSPFFISPSLILNFQKAGVFLSFHAGFSAKDAGFFPFYAYLLTMSKFTLHFFDTLLKNSTDKISLTKRLYILPLQR